MVVLSWVVCDASASVGVAFVCQTIYLISSRVAKTIITCIGNAGEDVSDVYSVAVG